MEKTAESVDLQRFCKDFILYNLSDKGIRFSDARSISQGEEKSTLSNKTSCSI